jgi:hypothetical protein
MGPEDHDAVILKDDCVEIRCPVPVKESVVKGDSEKADLDCENNEVGEDCAGAASALNDTPNHYNYLLNATSVS